MKGILIFILVAISSAIVLLLVGVPPNLVAIITPLMVMGYYHQKFNNK